MDSVTQVLLGSAVAATIAPKGYRKRAILTGAALGTLPDLDVILRYSTDVDNFTHHRGFSHSLFVLPIISLLLLPLLRWGYRLLSWSRLYLLIALTLLTHPLLDSLTAYGTQLFYPLTVTPTYIGSIFIIDPLYSLWLLIGVCMYLCSSRWRWVNTAGLVMSTMYLILGIGLQSVAKDELVKSYPEINPDEWYVGALTASPFCWRGVHKGNDSYKEVAFNIMNPRVMAEFNYPIVPAQAYPQSPIFERLQWFNPNTVLRKRGQQFISSDLRMGERGMYSFEFIITSGKENGKQLPMFDKPFWQPESINVAAQDYMQRNNAPSFPQLKWSQFLRCLRGES